MLDALKIQVGPHYLKIHGCQTTTILGWAHLGPLNLARAAIHLDPESFLRPAEAAGHRMPPPIIADCVISTCEWMLWWGIGLACSYPINIALLLKSGFSDLQGVDRGCVKIESKLFFCLLHQKYYGLINVQI